MRQLSNNVLSQLYGAQSDDPFLMLLTFTAPLETIRLANNTQDVISRGETYFAFPMKIRLPADDGESNREVDLELDNTTIELIDLIRTITSPVPAKIEMVLASDPNTVQVLIEDLKMKGATYNKNSLSVKLVFDGFLNTAMTSESYTPSNFPGLF
jgi:Domain of unknown function (DUF1833)